MSYIDMVEVVLNLVRASHEGNWALHMASIQSIIPWTFAYDNLNYARSLTAYYSEMSHIEHEKPDLYMFLCEGGFSAQLSATNTFNRVQIDEILEETVNRDTQTAGGTKGFSLNPAAVSRYYLTAEYKSSYLSILKSSLGLQQTDCPHKDLGQSRIAKDEEHITSIVDLLDSSWINPFAGGESLVSLSTGSTAPADVAEDLLNAHTIGMNAYRTFSAERVDSNPPAKQFHAPLSKMKLETFSSMQGKAKTCKTGNKEVILKADNRIFAQMVLIAKSRQLNLKEVLSHPLGPLPWALASPDGNVRKTCKSSLAKQLLKFPCVAESLPLNSTCVIDGMALVQKPNGDGKTFADIADYALSTVLAEASHSTRVDIVFDVYNEASIKHMERVARGADSVWSGQTDHCRAQSSAMEEIPTKQQQQNKSCYLLAERVGQRTV